MEQDWQIVGGFYVDHPATPEEPEKDIIFDRDGNAWHMASHEYHPEAVIHPVPI